MRKLNAYGLWKKLRSQDDPGKALATFYSPPNFTRGRFQHNHFTYDAIVEKLGNAGRFSDIEAVLNRLKSEKFVAKQELFGFVIKLYGQAKQPESAMKIFKKLKQFGHKSPNTRLVNTLLSALINCRRFDLVQKLRDRNLPAHMDNCTRNLLIKAACINGRIEDAWNLFERSKKPSVVTFGTMIAALCRVLDLENSLRLKNRMISKGITPNQFIYASLMSCTCGLGNLDQALELKAEMQHYGIVPDRVIYSIIVHGLCKASRFAEISELLQEIRVHGLKLETDACRSLVRGCCRIGDFKTARESFGLGLCEPDGVCYSELISGLCNAGYLDEAYDVFEDMPRRSGLFYGAVFDILLGGFCSHGRFNEAAAILDEMLFRGFIPKVETVTELVSGLCKNCNVDLALKLVRVLEEKCSIESSSSVWNFLVASVYPGCRQENVCRLFDQIVRL